MYSTSAEDALLKAKEIAARINWPFEQNLTGAGESISTAANGLATVATVAATAAAAAAAAPVTTTATATATVTTPASTPLGTERKRKRWGSVASPMSISQSDVTDALPGLAEAKLKQKQQQNQHATVETSGPSSKRIWVPTSRQKPETHFSSFLAERLPELLTIINDKECVGGEQNKLELSGRGASTIQVLGMPLEPMHIMIHGSKPFIAKAAPRLEELLAEGEQADLEGPPPEHLPDDGNDVDEKEDKYSNSSALTLTRPYYEGSSTTGRSSQSSYKPATVAQLISNNPDVLVDMCSGSVGTELLEEMIKIPNGVVGFIIGRGGETINSMQARSGCKVQIQKENELGPGQTERIITLQAVKQESIDECRGIIENMVQDRVNAAGGSSITRSSFKSGGSNAGNYYGNSVVDSGGNNSNSQTDSTEIKVQEALAEGHKLVKVEVPDADVGLVIGKGGVTIKFIQGSTGSCIQIPQVANADDASIRTISITCPTQEGAEAAKTQVLTAIFKTKNKINNTNNSNHDNNNINNGPPPASVQVAVPNKDVGLVIGRQGCVIKQLQGKTNTRINIPQQPVGNMRLITVTGPSQEACNTAKAYIERIVNEQSSAGVLMTGIYHNNQNHHHGGGVGGVGGAGGHHHYRNQHRHSNTSGMYVNQNSAQSNDPAWQAYHAAQALANKQHEELLQQHAAASAAPASDAYYEQFHRYAYYYGEKAAREYYDSWSPPVGTINPYGTNPAGITAPPTSESGPSVPVAQAQSQSQAAVSATNIEVRDSSARKVSNLPAWMTKS